MTYMPYSDVPAVAVTGDYVIGTSDRSIYVQASGATLTLPSPSSVRTGQSIEINNVGYYDVVVDAGSSGLTRKYWNTVTTPYSNMISLAWGTGTFVAFTETSKTGAYSTDGGFTWTVTTAPYSYSSGKTIVYSPKFNGFFMNGYNSTSAFSTDGMTWSATGTTEGIQKVIVAGSDRIVSGRVDSANSNGALTVDGVNWVSTSNSPYKVLNFAYNPNSSYYGTYVRVGLNTATASVCSGGLGYTSSNNINARAWSSIAFGLDKFIAVYGGASAASMSLNSTSWTETGGVLSSYNWYSIAYSATASKFVIVSASTAAYSSTGLAWSYSALPATLSWSEVVYGADKFVAVSQSTNSITGAYSTDGVTWTASTMPAGTWKSVAYGAGKFVAVASGATAAYSSDGITWTAISLPSTGYWQSLAYSPGIGKFVVGRFNSSVAAYSTDGITWTGSTTTSDACAKMVASESMFFCAPNNSNDNVGWSVDGINFYSTDLSNNAATWYAAAYGKGVFVMANQVGSFGLRVTDMGWSDVYVGISGASGIDNYSVVYGKDKFVTVGYGTMTAAYSSLGSSWTTVALPATAARTVEWDGYRYLIPCKDPVDKGNVMVSLDGIEWSKESAVGYGMDVVPSSVTYKNSAATTAATILAPAVSSYPRLALLSNRYATVSQNTTKTFVSDGDKWNVV